MRFEEKSYVNRCMDVVMGRDGDNVTLFIRLPGYEDLPDGVAQNHRQEMKEFLTEIFPDMQEVYSFRDTALFKVAMPISELYEKMEDFPKESEDDSVFRKEAEIALKKLLCARSARIYSEDAGLWETANLVSVKVFPKFPYPLRTDMSAMEDKDVVVISFPWLAYRFYAPLFNNIASLLIKSFNGKVIEEPAPTRATSSTWTKRIAIEGDERTRKYIANLVIQGLKAIGNFDVRTNVQEAKLKDSHVEKFARIATHFEYGKPARKQFTGEIKDRVVPYNDNRLIYIQLLPETYENKKEEVKKFVEEHGLKGGEFVQARGYYKSYIIGSADTMAGFEERIRFARELSERIGAELDISKPIVEIYDTRDASGNTRLCVRIPKPWDRKMSKEERKKAHEYAVSLNNLIKKFQAEEWEPVFPGVYVFTYSVLIPKDADISELESAREEAVEIISQFEDIDYAFVDMKEKKAAKAEKEIRKNIAEIER